MESQIEHHSATANDVRVGCPPGVAWVEGRAGLLSPGVQRDPGEPRDRSGRGWSALVWAPQSLVIGRHGRASAWQESVGSCGCAANRKANEKKVNPGGGSMPAHDQCRCRFPVARESELNSRSVAWRRPVTQSTCCRISGLGLDLCFQLCGSRASLRQLVEWPFSLFALRNKVWAVSGVA